MVDFYTEEKLSRPVISVSPLMSLTHVSFMVLAHFQQLEIFSMGTKKGRGPHTYYAQHGGSDLREKEVPPRWSVSTV